jgi:hypothetical protein
MTTLNNSNDDSRGSIYSTLFLDDSVVPVTPKLHTVTVIRPYPEMVDGQALPMVTGIVGEGEPDFSAVRVEEMIMKSGLDGRNKFTGLCACADRPGLRALDQPAAGTYVRLKSSMTKGQLTPAQLEIVAPAFKEVPRANNPKVKDRAIANGRKTLFMQCAVLTLRNEELGEKYISRGVLLCSGSLFTAMAGALTEAHQKGIDLFSPESGYTLVISSLPPDPRVGRQSDIYTVSIGDQMPVDPAFVSANVRPWNDLLAYMTYEQQLSGMIEAFGEDFMRIAFPHEVAMLRGNPSTVVEPQHSVSHAQPSLGRSGTMQGPPAAAPKPAVGLPKPTLGGPAKPAASLPKTAAAPAGPPKPALAPAMPRPAASAAAAAQVAPPNASQLEEEYNRMIAEQGGQSA